MSRANRAISPVSDTPPSWAISGHTRILKHGAANRYKAVLRDYKEFVRDKQLPEEYLPNHPAFEPPPIEQLRRFALYIARGKNGRLAEVPTVVSVCHKASDLTSAIRVLTGYTYDDDTIADVQAYVKSTLLAQGLVTNLKKPKFDFDRDDIDLIYDTLWTMPDPNCNSVRKVRSGRDMGFLSANLYLFSDYGARIAAMIPKTLQERTPGIEELWAILDPILKTPSPQSLAQPKSIHAIVGALITGLRYKDVVVTLTRKEKGSRDTEPIMTYKQRFFKGNDDTENLGIVTWSTLRERFLRDHSPFVLAYAFADEAFEEFRDPEALMTYKMPWRLESKVCSWRPDFQNLHVFRPRRNSPKPYTQYQWDSTFKLVTKQAGYTDTITVHRIRSATTQKVNATNITAAQHAHAFNQSHKVFQRHYMNEHTGVDLQGIMSGEPLRLDVPKLLSSARRSICRGLPTVLTAAQRRDVEENDPELRDLEARLVQCQRTGDDETASRLEKKIRYRRRVAFKEGLRAEQIRYHQAQLSANRDEDEDEEKEEKISIPQRRWARVMEMQPHHARIAKALTDGHCPSAQERVELLKDLVHLVRQEEPSLDEYPLRQSQCGQKRSSPQDKHPRYEGLGVEEPPAKTTRECALCRALIPNSEVDAHLIEHHLPRLPVDCGVFYYTTERKGQLINPGLCPFCLGKKELPVQTRFRTFTARRHHIDHLIRHLQNVTHDQNNCPHPSCITNHTKKELLQHLETVHGIDDLEHYLDSKSRKAKRKQDQEVLQDGSFRVTSLEQPALQLPSPFSPTSVYSLSSPSLPSLSSPRPHPEQGDNSWMNMLNLPTDLPTWPITHEKSPCSSDVAFEGLLLQLNDLPLPYKKRRADVNIGIVMKKRARAKKAPAGRRR